jgi:K+ transporter
LGANSKVGLLFYQAGVAVITGSVFQYHGVTSTLASASMEMNENQEDFNTTLTGSTIDNISDNFRHRMYNLSFNNTTELNSSVYFCRANNNEFNYSSNTTYLSSSKLRVKNNSTDIPLSYITTVGLYSADNELLAVAKLSEPLQKDPTTEFVLKVRLDY